MAGMRVEWRSLEQFTQQVFEHVGMPAKDARTEAEVLVWANLRGVDSHGVLRIPSYVSSAESGGMNPKPNIKVEKETPATVLIEADHAFGPIVTVFAMSRVIAKAKAVGIGWGLIRNTSHQGAMGYYSLMAAKEGMAGIAIVCNPPNMAPFGARKPGVHNSPISIAVPAKDKRPLCLDMATSVAAGGKVTLARDKGIPMPIGWAIDQDGRPTTDPAAVGALLPAGGPKGSGLAMMFECLTSLMVGNPLLAPSLLGGPAVRPGTQNSVVAAIDIGMFTDLEEYTQNVDRTVEGIKSLPTADGFDEVMVPGEPEDRVFEERKANGIPLPAGTVSNLEAVASRLGIEMPKAIG